MLRLALAMCAMFVMIGCPSSPPSTALPTAVVGRPYTLQVPVAASTACGKPACAWTASGLPSGLVMSPTTGAIQGTPRIAGAYHVQVVAQ